LTTTMLDDTLVKAASATVTPGTIDTGAGAEKQ